ncbi:MAG: hypothetical protein M3367_03220 [Acidobacteriota bacterium]|nr:hypothetical protein [Acidobacteriota bacterium]
MLGSVEMIEVEVFQIMHIKVTKNHIKNGERTSPNYCPVALAIREQIENSSCVEVCDELQPVISFFRDDELISLEAPDEVFEFVQAFDTRKRVKPFSFELSI